MSMKPKPRRCHGARTAALLIAWALVGTAPASAQAVAETPDSSASARGVSPGGAFVRAMLVPGWGHASLGSHTRAGFYFFVESVTAYGLLRTGVRLGEARKRLRFREDVARADLAAQGVVGEELEEGLAADPVVGDLRGLVDARVRQREDLLAFAIFMVFLSGVDAFVSGHLADFPVPLEMEGGAGADGGMEVAFSVALPR
jgi:hypothetical protein